MLKRDITYETFDGEKITETFYFNMSKAELIELEVEFDEGLAKMLQNIIKTKNNKEIIRIFKRIILLSYGKKSEDGKRFIKSDEIREEFSQTQAYSDLFMELASDDKAAVTFLVGVLPKDMATEIEKADLTALPQPPQPPTPPNG